MGEIECRDCGLSVTCAAAEFPSFRYAPLCQFSDIYPDLSVLGDFFDCTFLDNSIHTFFKCSFGNDLFVKWGKWNDVVCENKNKSL
jgi:hypothetical protein